MTRVAADRYWRWIRIVLGAYVVGIALVAVAEWTFLRPPPADVDLADGDLLGLLGGPLALLACVSACIAFMTARKRVMAVAAAAAVLTGLLSFVWYQRYTEWGTFIFNGDEYWVRRAARAGDIGARRDCLRVAISGIQYQLDGTQNEVLENFADDPLLQRDLFLVLEDMVAFENWKVYYRTQADRASERAERASAK